MAKKEVVEALVEGGKASAGPPIGSSLGPMGVNIGQVVAEINKKTDVFKGMKVPVKIIINKDTKEFTIEIGTPPTSALIIKELGLQGGSGIPNKLKIGNLSMEQAVKIAIMKQDSLYANNMRGAVKNVLGSCQAMGVVIEGKNSNELTADIDAGKYDHIIMKQVTEMPSDKKQVLADQLVEVQKRYAPDLERMKAAKEALAAAQEAKKAAAAGAKKEDGAATPAATAAPAKGAPAKASPAKK